MNRQKTKKILQEHAKLQHILTCIGEASGSLIFTIGINWSKKTKEPTINTFFSPFAIEALSVSVSFFIALLMFGPISLGHFNPAITIADYIKRLKDENLGRKSFSFFSIVIFSQFLGNVLGCLISALGNQTKINDDDFVSQPKIGPLFCKCSKADPG